MRTEFGCMKVSPREIFVVQVRSASGSCVVAPSVMLTGLHPSLVTAWSAILGRHHRAVAWLHPGGYRPPLQAARLGPHR